VSGAPLVGQMAAPPTAAQETAAFTEMRTQLGWANGAQIPTVFHIAVHDSRAVLNISAPGGSGQPDLIAQVSLETLKTDALGAPCWLPSGSFSGRYVKRRDPKRHDDQCLIVPIMPAGGAAEGIPPLATIIMGQLWALVTQAHLDRQAARPVRP